MSVFFEETTKTFYLEGKGVTYAFYINEFGYAEHLYYGNKIGHDDLRAMRTLGAVSFRVTPPARDGETSTGGKCINSYNHFPTELSFFGTGDYRESTVSVCFSDGCRITELLYCGHEILAEKPKINGMPSMLGGETLVLHLRDEIRNFGCDLYYTVYEDCSIVARRAVYKNNGDDVLYLRRAYSFAMSLPSNRYDAISLYGNHCKERYVERTPLHHGVFSIDSKRTTSSATLNPFIMLMDKDTTEYMGNAYGISLIYSSSYILKAECTNDGRTLVTG
ncbi:MAG: hypothetical protein IKJ00_05190, partial [Clostridia bacterium]|nr:hypothetical protein [Clostridia bacterium]